MKGSAVSASLLTSATLERLNLDEEAYLYWNKFSCHFGEYTVESGEREATRKQRKLPHWWEAIVNSCAFSEGVFFLYNNFKEPYTDYIETYLV